MSENQAVLKVETIPGNAVVTIEISGGFYARLHQLFYGLSSSVTPEQFAQVLDKIKQQKAHEDPLAYHIETVITLLTEIEDKAKEQGRVQVVDVPKPPAGN